MTRESRKLINNLVKAVKDIHPPAQHQPERLAAKKAYRKVRRALANRLTTLEGYAPVWFNH
jgi:hypothetical protein